MVHWVIWVDFRLYSTDYVTSTGSTDTHNSRDTLNTHHALVPIVSEFLAALFVSAIISKYACLIKPKKKITSCPNTCLFLFRSDSIIWYVQASSLDKLCHLHLTTHVKTG